MTSPPNDRSRPRQEGGSEKVIAATGSSIAPDADIAGLTREHDACVPRQWSDRESALAWQLAYVTGWVTGYAVGEDDYGRRIDAWLGVTREALKAPTQADLTKAREYTTEPCNVACGRCSRCIRAAVARRNMARYGSPDYPGLAA